MFDDFFKIFKSDTSGKRNIPDFFYWNIFVIIMFIHYATKTKGTPLEGTVSFFFYIWIGSYVGLIALKQYTGNRRKEIMDYDENTTSKHIDYIFIGLLGIEFVALVISSIAQGLISQQMDTAQQMVVPMMSWFVPQLSLDAGEKINNALAFRFYDDALFNIGPVATAEELSKVVFIRAVYMKLQYNRLGRVIAVLSPISFWALLHGYQSYVMYGNTVMYLMILSAFLSGVFMYWVWKKTKNILIAIWVHGIHNAMVVLSPALKEILSGGVTLAQAMPFLMVIGVIVVMFYGVNISNALLKGKGKGKGSYRDRF